MAKAIKVFAMCRSTYGKTWGLKPKVVYTANRNIYILSDSQAALKALDSCRVDSRLVLDCIRALNKLGRLNRVVLVWVPGHVGVMGNEMADELARKGSERAMCGPEPCMGLSIGTIKDGKCQQTTYV